jgi:phenylacetate-CoA ligase
MTHSADIFRQSPAQWRSLQAARLQQHLQYAATSPLYRAYKFSTQSITADNLVETAQQLPLTTKDDLAHAGTDAYIRDGIAEWVSTSGTLGRALDVPLTSEDLERLAENEAAALSVAGVHGGDTVLLGVGMDRMFVAGLAYWLGAQKLSATTIRLGALVGAQAAMLSEVLQRTPTTAQAFLITVPSFLLTMQVAPARAQKLAGIIAIGEPIRNADLSYNTLGQRLHEIFHCPIMSTYASTETCTTFAEGPNCKGGHLNPNLAIVEILGDDSRPVPDCAPGEVVVTPLGVKAMPLLRFRTGDIAALHTGPCPCGRTTPRLGPILGRRQQLLKLRGTSIYPNAIIEALRTLDDVIDCAITATRDEFGTDQITVHVHAKSPNDSTIKAQIDSRLVATLRVTPEVKIIDAATLATLHGPTRKPQRFLDYRSK